MRWTDVLRSALAVAALAVRADAQPAPPLSLLDVPFIAQSEALCGGAAASMILRYWGERGVDAESFAHLADASEAGIRTTALIDELRRRAWNATELRGSGELLSRELARGRPVLTLIEDRPGTYHYVVIVGRTDDALVFHDPARAPLRVMPDREFTRRWSAANRWMAIVLPPARTVDALRPAGAPPANACDATIADGVARAQAGDLAAAEERLAGAVSCPGSPALREMAGVRLLQRRWPEVEALAAAAIGADAGDMHAWRLLATSRYVQGDATGALDAWNHAGEPRLDLVSVAGLTRTRQRPVEQLVGVRAGGMLTADDVRLARRRLAELPSAESTRLAFTPVPSGLAELRAVVSERPLLPADPWSYAAIGVDAAANREISVATGSLFGGGESVAASWRFWPERERLFAAVSSPAPWGGVLTVHGESEHESFDTGARLASVGGRIELGQWVTSNVRLAVRGGADRWTGLGAHMTVGAELRMPTAGDRLQLSVSGDVWAGAPVFARLSGRLTLRSSPVRAGYVGVVHAGAGWTGPAAPATLWFAGDTGHARDIRLRAHPLLEDDRLTTTRLGRGIVHASLEGQRWWTAGLAAVGAAVFADAARVARRVEPGSLGDTDVGIGARLALPGVRGVVRADLARGLRDGATALSLVFEP